MFDNPYTKAPPPNNGGPSKTVANEEPLFGFLPRKVTAQQAQKAMVR